VLSQIEHLNPQSSTSRPAKLLPKTKQLRFSETLRLSLARSKIIDLLLVPKTSSGNQLSRCCKDQEKISALLESEVQRKVNNIYGKIESGLIRLSIFDGTMNDSYERDNLFNGFQPIN
jgi:hypothetical protein